MNSWVNFLNGDYTYTFKPYTEAKENQPGMFYTRCGHVYIKEVIYNNPATIVMWSDNTKTVCKCAEGDVYSKEVGLTLCIMKKLVGGSKMYNIFDSWVTDKNRITLKEVRKNSRR